MVIGVVNQKGGVGKSTVATNIAASLANQGGEILLVDADPQKSALDWAADRDDAYPHVTTIGLPVRNLHQEIKPFRGKYDLILIDGGGRITESARAAVSVADFVIVPTKPSKPDVISTEDFFAQVIQEVAAIKGEVKGAILVNMLKKGTVMGRESEKHLKGLGLPMFDTVLHDYVDYQEAWAKGLSVVEYAKREKAAQEMLSFLEELKEILP